MRCLPVLALLAVVGVHAARAAMPDAGTKIVNQGSVYFTDENGTDRQTSTNIVTLTVRQVYAASVQGDASLYAAPDREAVMFHTVTNLGNGVDSYCVTVEDAVGDSGDFDRLQVVVDENHNGAADSGEEVLHLSGQAGFGLLTLERDQYAHLLVMGKTPVTAVNGQAYGAILMVRAQAGTGACQVGLVADTGANGDGTDDTNNDTVTITNNGVLKVTKTSSYQEYGLGTDDDSIIYTVFIENVGANDAKDVEVTDSLPPGAAYIPASLVAVSAEWVGANGVDDGNDGEDGLAPVHDGGAPGVIAGEIDILPAGSTVLFQYEVALDNGLAGGTVIENTAAAQGDLNDAPPLEPAVDSNTTKDVFPFVYAVDITDTGAGEGAGVNDGGDDDPANDSQLVDEVDQGATVLFTNVLTNQGNSEDAFNLEVTASTFPADTQFVFYNASGTVRLLDTNGDGLTDTGPLARGAFVNIVVKAILPSTASGVGPYAATVTASSVNDPSGTPASDAVSETLGAITGLMVDLANSPASPGLNDGGVQDADASPAVITTLSAVPGKTVIFSLYAANEGDVQDDYELTAWSNAATNAALPAGVHVEFTRPTGEKVTHTGPLSPGAVFAYYAKVTPAADMTTGTVPIFFRVKSPVTGVQDVKADSLVVAIDESIALSPNHYMVIAPGSVVHYIHLLQNTGNTSENVKVYVDSQSDLAHLLQLPVAAAGPDATTFWNIGALNIGDNVMVYDPDIPAWKSVALVDDGSGGVAIPMEPGDYTQIRVRVMAHLNVVEFTRDVLILKADVTAGSASVSAMDVTTVSQSQLTITKSGAVDTDCNGVADTAFGTATFQAEPGQCVIWKLIIVNSGPEPICQVTVHDGAVAFTVLDGLPTIISQPVGGLGACAVTGQEFECTLGKPYDIDGDGGPEPFCLMAGEQAEIRFRVRIE